MSTTAAATAVAMYETGETIAAITAATGLTENVIANLVRRAGLAYYPDTRHPVQDSLTPTQIHTATDTILLACRRTAVVAAAEEAVRRAEQYLADARANLIAARANHVTIPIGADR